MTPPGVGWRCSNRLMSGMAPAVKAQGDRLADPGDALLLRAPIGLKLRIISAIAAGATLAVAAATNGLGTHGGVLCDLAERETRMLATAHGSNDDDTEGSTVGTISHGMGAAIVSPTATEVVATTTQRKWSSPAPAETSVVRVTPRTASLELHPLASTARSGLVLAVEPPLSPLRHRAAAGVGWARPTAVLRLGGARILVLRCPDAPPASS